MNDRVSLVISVCSLLATGVGTYFTWKIFAKGLQINREKVLITLSMEFVTGFHIPFSEVTNIKKKILETPSNLSSIHASTLLDLLKVIKFNSQLSYYSDNRGDVLDALSPGDKPLEERINAIQTVEKFVADTQRLRAGIDHLVRVLDEYTKKSPNSSLADFLKDSTNNTIWSHGCNLMDELEADYLKLPPVLKDNIDKIRKGLSK